MIYHTHAENIEIPKDRQRQHFDEKRMEELKASILSIGLIHPLVVEEVGKDKFSLVAGERRLRALGELIAEGKSFKFGTAINHTLIPVILRPDLTPEKRYELELEENIQRDDLTWQERAKSINRLHELQGLLSGEPATISETVERTRRSHETVSAAIAVAPHLDDPEIAKAKTAKDAVKILEKRAEAKHRAILARTYKTDRTPHQLLKGDFFEKVFEIPDEQFDCIITDPQYGIDADSFGEQAGTGHNYSDTPEEFRRLVDFMSDQTYRTAKPQSFLYLFCDLRWFEHLDLAFTLAGWKVRHRPLIWDKLGTGMLPVPDFEPRNTYECILYARKGERTLVKKGAPDVVSYMPPKRLLHGAQKPVELYTDLLARVVLPGCRVGDFFCGSGTVFVAANRLSLTALGIEKDEEQCNNATLRMAEKELGGETEVEAADDIVL